MQYLRWINYLWSGPLLLFFCLICLLQPCKRHRSNPSSPRLQNSLYLSGPGLISGSCQFNILSVSFPCGCPYFFTILCFPIFHFILRRHCVREIVCKICSLFVKVQFNSTWSFSVLLTVSSVLIIYHSFFSWIIIFLKIKHSFSVIWI